MAIDYGAKEREFLDSLEADTGRTLAAWMAAIDAAGLGERNAIIDWLRHQGFMFSKASWLERIHHNGGQPLYGDGAAGRIEAAIRKIAETEGLTLPGSPVTRATAEPEEPARPFPSASPPAAPVAVPAAPPPPPVAFEGLEEVLAAAKAYRPLAQHTLAALAEACPGLSATARDGYVLLAGPAEFGVLVPGPRDIRLGLDLGGWPFVAPLQKSKLAGPPPRFGHMAVLTDARQVDGNLLRYVRAARERARAAPRL